MGAVNTTYTFTATDTITSTKMNNIIDQTTITDEAIVGNTLEVASGKLKVRAQGITSNEMATGSVTSNAILDGTIVNADINASAAIAGTKISPNFGSQNISTTGTISTSTNYLSRQQTPDEGGEIQFARALDNATAFTVDCYGSGSSPNLRIFGTTGQVATITASGNVGIGTSSPQNVFEVNAYSTARSSANTGTAKIEAQSNDYWTGATYTGTSITQSGSAATGTTCGLSNANLGALTFQNGSAGLINTNGATPIVFATTSSERMRINGSGNIGIGKTNPSTILDVNGTVTATAFSGPLTGNVTGNVSGSSGSCTGNSATATTAASCSGNSATATLATKASTLSQGGGNGTAMTFNWSGQGGQPTWLWGGNDGANHYVYNPANFSVNYANSSNYANSTAYASRAAEGPLNGSFTQSHTANVNKISVGGFGTNKGWGIYLQRAANENSSALHFAKETGATVGSIVLDTANSTNYNTTSDYRLKEDFKPIANPLDKLCSLNPLNFKWIDNDTRLDGFLAHEVKAVVCNAVTGEKDDVDENGNPIYQQIDQSKLIPIMVAAIQELSQKVAELEAK